MNLTVLHAHKPGSNTELPISKKILWREFRPSEINIPIVLVPLFLGQILTLRVKKFISVITFWVIFMCVFENKVISSWNK